MNSRIIGRALKILKTLYIIVKAFLLAVFFIYIIGGFWLIPFNYLLPEHFTNFQAITLRGRLIERISFLFSFLAALGYVHLIKKDFKSLLPSPNLGWIIKAKEFIKIASFTFLCLAITYLISLSLGFIKINPNESHFLLTDFFQSLNYIFLIGIIGHFLVALGEEAVYRGLIFRYLFKETENLNIALFISALTFALFHFHYSAPFSFLVAFLAGYLFAQIYYHSGSLLYCISIHWSYNLFMHLFIPNSKDYLINYFNVHLQDVAGWGSSFSFIRIIAFMLIIFTIKSVLKHKTFTIPKLFNLNR